jgi:putative zinc finger/helix-turn-helix YgiT family protein
MYYCEYCNKDIEGVVKEIHSFFDIKGVAIEATIHERNCNHCGNPVWDESLETQNQRILYSLYRKRNNLLQPEDIKSIRDKYSLSQQSFARLLGFGDKTITRYENGSIQDVTHDLMIRLCNEMPSFRLIYNQRISSLSPTDIAKVNKVLSPATSGVVDSIISWSIKRLKLNPMGINQDEMDPTYLTTSHAKDSELRNSTYKMEGNPCLPLV